MATHANHNGWIKSYRQLLNNPIIKKPKYCHLWNVLLLLAQHRTSNFIWGKQKVALQPGQLLTGRRALFELTGIPETTVERILDYLVGEQQIKQQKTNKFRIITIKNWGKYQSDQNSGQQIGQQADTYKNDKERYSPNSDEFRLSNLLFNEIRNRKPDYKKPNLQKWSVYIDRMIRLDNRDPTRIEEVIRWCQRDGFWQNNILSTDKLRKQFDKLELKMGKGQPPETAPLQRDENGLTPIEKLRAQPKKNEGSLSYAEQTA